ncbi:RNA polymerase [Actinorhabdospora filicis]|uniref:RNA polymerase n=1 Tax=Actinorhabdospora filicis TaxID=1785913 RepID=A0A9W6SMM6_9ACTN|nr:SigE family RNA polymerase sigma factor [Actinorhabdospora filicis]GLZ79720.1 RNA polymerase [Actinorhabdospora filicis]
MSSFDEYVRARGSGLLRFAYLLCQDRHLAEDLTQEALARCHRSWKRVSNAGDPDAYVRKAVLRQFLSWRRRKSAMEKITADMTAHERSLDDGSASRAERSVLWTRLAALPRKQRAALVMRFYLDLDYAAISALMGCAESTARVHVHKGLATLRTTDLAHV